MFKLKIKVKNLSDVEFPKIIKKGDWVDLRAAETIELEAAQSGILKQKKYRDVTIPVTLIPLGVSIQLPKGFEALVVLRSSTPKKLGIMQANSIGIIDNSYCGDDDEWKLPVIPLETTTIVKGERICQFRIQLSQKATFIQKLKWLFSNGIKVVKVSNLNNKNRGGFGSTN